MVKDIVMLIAEDRETAFTMLYDKYWAMIFRQAFAKVGNEDVAADLSQETFTILWKKLDQVQDIESCKAFLFGVLRNKTLQYFEKNKSYFNRIFEINQHQEQILVSAHELLVEKETKGLIQQVIDRMPEQMRKIYLLKKEEEYSIQEISDQLSLSPQTIKNQLHAAYNRLKKVLFNGKNYFL